MNLHGDDTHGLRIILDALDTHHVARFLIPDIARRQEEKRINIFHVLSLKFHSHMVTETLKIYIYRRFRHEIPLDINVRTCDACLNIINKKQ